MKFSEEIVYLECAGKQNLEILIDEIEKVLVNSNYPFLVVPTSTGKVVDLLIEKEIHKKTKVVAVLLHNGFHGEDSNRLSTEKRVEFLEHGIEVFQGTHSLSGVERAVSRKFGGVSSVEIIAASLKLFGGDGVKVAIEVAVMAADAGIIPTTEEVLVAGGTSGGLDTLVAMKSAHMNNFFDLNLSRIFVKPLKREEN